MSSQSIEIKHANWQRDKHILRAIRTRVFIEEQRVPVELEWDEQDARAEHFLLYCNEQDGNEHAIGCARVILATNQNKRPPKATIGRMAVIQEERGNGYGLQLLKALIDYCRHAGVKEICLSAQCHAIQFYQRLGFVVEGDIFMDAGIEHRSMRLKL